jgi:hypothetical protein
MNTYFNDQTSVYLLYGYYLFKKFQKLKNNTEASGSCMGIQKDRVEEGSLACSL